MSSNNLRNPGIILLGALILLLQACAAPGRVDQRGVSSPDDAPATTKPTTRPTPTIATPDSADTPDVSAGIRSQAAAATDAGEFASASRLLDRAVRLAPRQPSNYYELARLRLQQNQPDQALQFIRKGLSLNPSTVVEAQLQALSDSISQ